jgi:hypothetical protein
MVGVTEKQISLGDDRKGQLASGRLPWLGWAILLLTAVVSLTWSAHKLLEQDEIFSLQTDRVSSFSEVLRIQRLYPISLEPPPYHLLAHAAMKVLGPTAFALRLPAFLGYLLMQFCLYFFVRNLVGEGEVARRAGLVAMAIPSFTWTLYYAAEGRPYGVLLGSYALAALCWQIATHRGEEGKSRVWPLIGLATALVFTINVHFYGVLLLVAVCGAELIRTMTRRTFDGGAISAIAVGIASIVATLPYVKASGEFKKHYYAGPVSAHMLTQPYRQMLLDYTSYPKPVQSALMLGLLLAGLAVVFSALRVARRKEIAATRADWAMVVLLALMPGFAFVLGRLVTHALEVRHSIGAIVGISSLATMAALPRLRRKSSFAMLITAMLLCCLVVNSMRIKDSARADRGTLSSLVLSSSLMNSINANPDQNIYFQDLGKWETASLYEPNPVLRSRLVLVYSREEEMQHEQHDTMYLTAIHTQKFSTQKIISYDALRIIPGDHIFATYSGSGWDWIDEALIHEAAQVNYLGNGFGGKIVKVQFKQ